MTEALPMPSHVSLKWERSSVVRLLTSLTGASIDFLGLPPNENDVSAIGLALLQGTI